MGLRSLLRALRMGAPLLLLVAVATPGGLRAADQDTVTVFAAASLTDALQQLAADWRQQGGGEVRYSFAASSTLARQIEAGAPADIFISANPEWMDYLAGKNLIIPESRTAPLGNDLVLVAPADSPLAAVQIDSGLDIAALVSPGDRIATGDPAHVPVGMYAQQAFTKLGLWEKVDPLLARADSVRAALALVERGEAPLGIVYASDAVASSKVKVVGKFPADSHDPINYPFAIIVGHDTPAVRAFFASITGGGAAKVYERFGFVWLGPTG